MNYLIGLMGKKRSGKDTVAQYLVEKHRFTRFAFADALKEFLLDSDPPIHGERLSAIVAAQGWDEAKCIPEVRRLLQDVGTDMRGLDPDYWLDIVRRKTEMVDGPVVISDVRLPNEAAWVKQSGGALWRIHRPATEDPRDFHHSETALDGYPVSVHLINDLGLWDLYTFVDFVLDVRNQAGREV